MCLNFRFGFRKIDTPEIQCRERKGACMSTMEVLTLILVVFAALNYINDIRK